MNSKTRRFAAALSLALVLAGSPAAFAASRGGDDRVNAPITKIVKRILKLIGVTINAEPTVPIPGPSSKP